MSKHSKAGSKPVKAEDGEMRAEYDLKNGRPNPYAELANRPTRAITLEPELAALFPDSDSVNQALKLMVKASVKAVRHAKAS